MLRFEDNVATGTININQIGMTREWGNRGIHSGGFFSSSSLLFTVMVLVVVVVIYELTSVAFVSKLILLSLVFLLKFVVLHPATPSPLLDVCLLNT